MVLVGMESTSSSAPSQLIRAGSRGSGLGVGSDSLESARNPFGNKRVGSA